MTPNLDEGGRGPALPSARGPLSAAVLHALGHRPGPVRLPPIGDLDALVDDDLQLALACCYELHYRSFAGVDPGWEWAPALLDLRGRLEHAFEAALLDQVASPRTVAPRDVPAALEALAHTDLGPSLSAWMLRSGTRRHMREFCVHRSVYQRKEADPHTWALPRLAGPAKAAMADIQHDEYGAGDAAAVHAELFATTMRDLGLDERYGAYLDIVPGVTLATTNLVSMLGLHRQWRGACVGHLALYEMTSVVPMRRYSDVLARLGVGPAGRRFYDVHVTADAVHEVVAVRDMVAPLVAADPSLCRDVLFGALAATELERRFTVALLGAWDAGRPSLLRALPDEPTAVGSARQLA